MEISLIILLNVQRKYAWEGLLSIVHRQPGKRHKIFNNHCYRILFEMFCLDVNLELDEKRKFLMDVKPELKFPSIEKHLTELRVEFYEDNPSNV